MDTLNVAQKIFYLSFLVIYPLLIIICLYTSYINLIKKRFSKYGFDRFIIVIFGKRSMKNKIENNKNRIKGSGIALLLIAIGGLSEIIGLINKYIPLIF